MRQRSSSRSCFALWPISESPSSGNTFSRLSLVLMTLKFNNGAGLSSICMTRAIVNCYLRQGRKRTRMSYFLTGRTTFTSSLRLTTSTSTTFRSWNSCWKKMHGKRELTSGKGHFSPLSSIGAITSSQSLSTQKISSGNIFLVTTGFCMHF